MRPLRDGSPREELRCLCTPNEHTVTATQSAPQALHVYNFDYVAGEGSTQQEVYEGELAGLW